MPIVYLTRRATFSSSHRLHSARLSDRENRELFGKCNNPNGHGHNYEIEVTIKGEVDPDSGIVVNLAQLKEVIAKSVVDLLDHRNLNLDVEAFASLNPTAENIAVVCWQLLQTRLPKGSLHEVRLRETENNVVVYRGE